MMALTQFLAPERQPLLQKPPLEKVKSASWPAQVTKPARAAAKVRMAGGREPRAESREPRAEGRGPAQATEPARAARVSAGG